jgi:hypothetical protein
MPSPVVGYIPNGECPKEIHDRSQLLLQVYSEDNMKETCYHVEDFAGLYPIWPIIEFSMAPTGNSKDKRMNSFFKCVLGLLGELLYVDGSEMIAPLIITDNDLAIFISNKVHLPTNFMKLGKYIMINGGSWVFNKKEKGSNDV